MDHRGASITGRVTEVLEAGTKINDTNRSKKASPEEPQRFQEKGEGEKKGVNQALQFLRMLWKLMSASA